MVRLLNPRCMESSGLIDTGLNIKGITIDRIRHRRQQSNRRNVRTNTTNTYSKSKVTTRIPYEVFYGIKVPATHDTWMPLALQRYGECQYKDDKTPNHQLSPQHRATDEGHPDIHGPGWRFPDSQIGSHKGPMCFHRFLPHGLDHTKRHWMNLLPRSSWFCPWNRRVTAGDFFECHLQEIFICRKCCVNIGNFVLPTHLLARAIANGCRTPSSHGLAKPFPIDT